MTEEEHYRKLESMYASGPVNDYYAPKLQVSKGVAEVTIQVRPDFFHAAGAVHGSVYLKLPAAICGECSALRQCFAATVRKFTFFDSLANPVASYGECAR